MALRKDLAQVGLIGVIALSMVGCRIKAIESQTSASAPNTKSPYKGDPYTYGGVAEGSGGLLTTTTQTMDTPSYEGAKFKKAAGPEAYTDSNSGHHTAAAKPSDISGDYQPLPHNEGHEGGHGEHDDDEGEGH
ncbi:MAG: hypothetical protein BGO01_14770 [Armatimonadetes bacterium 55-13]|nr:hypothetical protein [Armatimonadota bacterium]OJU64969.1 MAG: hypothetical protein BGO01_14770 [Armatimonadetes bacterium 55-13]